MAIKVDQLTNEIMKHLREYTDEVKEDIDKSKNKVANKGVRTLKATSPVGYTGKYAKGWRKKKVGTAIVVHNKTDYQLTHLLEKGHLNRDGSRTGSKVHIKPVEQEMIQEFEKSVKEAIKK